MKKPLSLYLVASFKLVMAVLAISTKLGSLAGSRSTYNTTCELSIQQRSSHTLTYLVAHVGSGEQAEVRLRSCLRLAALERVEARAVSEDVVALLARVLQNVEVVGTARAGGGVGEEEAIATTEEKINAGAERGVSNELRRDEVLRVATPDMRPEGGRGRMLRVTFALASCAQSILRTEGRCSP